MNGLMNWLVWSAVTAGAQFVPLGKPVAEMGLAFNYVSDGPAGHPLVWAAIRPLPAIPMSGPAVMSSSP